MNIFGTSFNYRKRLGKIRRLMDERDIDCVLVHLWPNQYYISGMYQHMPWYPVEVADSTEAPLIVFRERGEEPVFLAANIVINAVEEGTWIKDVRAYQHESTLSSIEYTAKILSEKGVDAGNIGIEEECCTLSTFRKLKAALPNANFKDASEIFHLARIVKEPEEIKLIQKSVSVAEAGLKAGMAAAKVGVLESEVQKATEIEMKRREAIREVETMFQSGIRTANFRCFASNWKRIAKNDLCAIDIGCVYKGYGSDITRTWVVGKATDEMKKRTENLYRLHVKILDFIKPGIKISEFSDFVRNEITKREMRSTSFPGGEAGQIHGIGLGPFHDPPHARDRDTVLENGMTIAVPTCYRHK